LISENLKHSAYSIVIEDMRLSLLEPVIIDFDKSIIKYPNIKRFVGGASNDLVPDLQHPDNPVPLLKEQIEQLHIGGGGG
jgi:hypothetical protein